MSETSKCRARLQKYCTGIGLDIGYGGDPIIKTAITVDLKVPYTKVGDHPCNIQLDCKEIDKIFKENSLDYIFSSHLLEDFLPDEIQNIFWKWMRLIRPGGFLVLYLPDQQRYLKNCEKEGSAPNANHKILNFSLEYLKSIIDSGPSVVSDKDATIVHENPDCDGYSFEVVFKKDLKIKKF